MAADGKPQNDLADLDADTLSAIRNLVTETDIEPDHPPAAASDQVDAAAAPAPVAKRVKARKTAEPVQHVAAQPEAPRRAPRGPVEHVIAPQENAPAPKPKGRIGQAIDAKKAALAGRAAEAKASVLGYRPTVKHMLIAAAVLLVVFRPWLVVAIVLFNIVLLIGVFLVLGYDGFWKKAMALGRWYARKRPQKSAELHKKLDRFAMRWDEILDRFPEGTVDALYMPDFSELEQADARHDAVMARRLGALGDK